MSNMIDEVVSSFDSREGISAVVTGDRTFQFTVEHNRPGLSISSVQSGERGWSIKHISHNKRGVTYTCEVSK